jgi:hypothetical protein
MACRGVCLYYSNNNNNKESKYIYRYDKVILGFPFKDSYAWKAGIIGIIWQKP